MPRVLLLEFNEICPPLLERWIAAGKLPNFARLRASSQVYVSVADETNPTYLEPWIQWYSIHTGLPYSEHKVFYLTDGPKAGHRDIWQALRAAGKSVMNCGSMNAKGITGEGTFFLPDPWCTSEAAYPAELEIFKRVVATKVQEYTNAGRRLAPDDYVHFAGFLARHRGSGGEGDA